MGCSGGAVGRDPPADTRGPRPSAPGAQSGGGVLTAQAGGSDSVPSVHVSADKSSLVEPHCD